MKTSVVKAAFLTLAFCHICSAQDKPIIKAAPVGGRLIAVGQTQLVSNNEFEFFNLTGYEGKVTWDVSLPDGIEVSPIKLFPVQAGQIVIGTKVGTDAPEVHLAPDGQSVAIFAVGTGKVMLKAWGVLDGAAIPIAELKIQAQQGPRPPPTPVDPVDPDPVDPDPVDPTPTPMPITGLRVLIVYESSAALTREQLNIINSTALITYLNEKCVKSASGQPDWRRWDKSTIDITGLANETKIWQDLWPVVSPTLKKLPALVIVNDTKSTVYDLPATEAETLAFIKKIVEGK